jgi:hypothetical protein
MAANSMKKRNRMPLPLVEYESQKPTRKHSYCSISRRQEPCKCCKSHLVFSEEGVTCVAIKHCSRCHVIGDHNPYGGIGSTPSFQLLAKREDYLERFQTFYERRPHPVYVRVPGVPKWTELPSHVEEFTVRVEDIENIIAFVETLRKK